VKKMTGVEDGGGSGELECRRNAGGKEIRSTFEQGQLVSLGDVVEKQCVVTGECLFQLAVTIVSDALYHGLERGVDIYSREPGQYLGMPSSSP
jgi:hypothetical protein